MGTDLNIKHVGTQKKYIVIYFDLHLTVNENSSLVLLFKYRLCNTYKF